MKITLNSIRQVRHNKRVHDSVVPLYEQIHTEIYNSTEQLRISSVLATAIFQINTSAKVPLVFDFGAGTGNLTRHLLKNRARVLAADVSLKSLSSLEVELGDTGRINVMELNGVDLSNMEDSSVDMVASYSVLHHVPDYLGIVREFVRVLKPGGVVYIDHEKASSVWLDESEDFVAYNKEFQEVYGQPFVRNLVRKIRLLFSFNAWKRLINRKFFGLSHEGDIHVFKDDHIEWNRVEDILLEQCTLIKGEDYLVCREADSNPTLHGRYSEKCVDMRVVIYKKK